MTAPQLSSIRVADIYGWLDATPGDRVFEPLAIVPAWILAGGSILQQTHVPRFAVGNADPETLLTENSMKSVSA